MKLQILFNTKSLNVKLVFMRMNINKFIVITPHRKLLFRTSIFIKIHIKIQNGVSFPRIN